MTLEEARLNIGAEVVYYADLGADPDEGVITDIRYPFVMVRYVGDNHAKATHPEDLTLLRRRGEEL